MSGRRGVRRPSFKKSFADTYPLGTMCHYCKVVEATTRDHVVPFAICKSNNSLNIVPCCYGCNHLKADKVSICKCDFCTQARDMFLENPIEFYVGFVPGSKKIKPIINQAPDPNSKRSRNKKMLESNMTRDGDSYDIFISENLRYLYKFHRIGEQIGDK